MPQFLLGFWCGCVFSMLTVCWLYWFVKQKRMHAKQRVNTESMAERTQETEAVQSKARILLVDDSKLSRTLIKNFLLNCRIDIEEAESGAECLLKNKKQAFDLIFMDINMPGGSGMETLKRLQKDTEGKKVPRVIVMGSDVRRENEAKYLEMGFAGCLAKPIQASRLEELLNVHLSEEVLKKIPGGFSYEKGLVNFDGNEEVYRETLVLFASLWEERKESLQNFLEEENMPEYAILIHAIKGDARTLGAELLADLAYEQELCAKAGDAEAVRRSFAHVIQTGTDTAEYFATSFSS